MNKILLFTRNNHPPSSRRRPAPAVRRGPPSPGRAGRAVSCRRTQPRRMGVGILWRSDRILGASAQAFPSTRRKKAKEAGRRMPNGIHQSAALRRRNLPPRCPSQQAGPLRPVPWRSAGIWIEFFWHNVRERLVQQGGELVDLAHHCSNYPNKGFIFFFGEVISHVVSDAVHGSENAAEHPVDPDRNVTFHEPSLPRSARGRRNLPNHAARKGPQPTFPPPFPSAKSGTPVIPPCGSGCRCAL